MKRIVPGLAFLIVSGLIARGGERGWIELLDGQELRAWNSPSKEWLIAGDAALDPANPKKLVGKAGKGVFLNGPKGTTSNLLTKQAFGDVEVHVEFVIPKGSNSGVKLNGLYEIQILDSWGKKEVSADDCGGIYPRAELTPKYHLIDKGTPPRANASRPPGEWQTLDIVFRAPRFDSAKKKVENARFVQVVLNGKLIHENVELAYATGHAWHLPEVARGPLLLQADHGPVAFRNVRIRPLDATSGKP